MKKLLLLFLLNLMCFIDLQSQTSANVENVKNWSMTGGVHFFTKQIVKPNYEPLQGLNIYSKPTFALALEVTRFFKIKEKWSSSIAIRLGQIPSNQGVDIAENITRNGFAFDDYDIGRLPYAAFKGLINLTIWKKNRLSIMQSLGTSFVLVPHGFANYSIISASSGTNVPYYISKGLYNPDSLPFFSALSETSLIYTKNCNKKWLFSISFELAPKNVVVSDYIFYTKTNELKGTVTRRYQQMGLHFGGFLDFEKKKKIK